jgi:hypothetical protein
MEQMERIRAVIRRSGWEAGIKPRGSRIIGHVSPSRPPGPPNPHNRYPITIRPIG